MVAIGPLIHSIAVSTAKMKENKPTCRFYRVQYPKLRNMAHTTPVSTCSLLPKDRTFIFYLLLRLESSSKQCSNYLTPFRHLSLI